MQNKILTISLLVSGREDTTIKCLDSLQPLMDKLDSELILVDTGCTEAFRAKLQKYTKQMIPFTWCDDFAKARNAGLEQATGEWFLFVDDDEWFADVTPIIEFFQSGEYRDYDQAVYYARNYAAIDGSEYSDDLVSRMIHLEPDTHFEGAVHEELVPVKGKCKKINAYVHHFGYAFVDEASKRAHFERNLAILQKLKAEQPDNLRWPLHLLKEYDVMRDGKQLREEALQTIARIQAVNVPFANLCRGAFYCAVLQGDIWEKDAAEFAAHMNAFSQDARNSAEVNCTIYKYGIDGADAFSDESMRFECCKNYFACYEEYRKAERTEQEQIILESMLYINTALSENVVWNVRMKWAEAGIALGRCEEFPEAEREQLRVQIAKQFEGNGEFLQLPESYWTLAVNGILPLEEILLSLPISQWMAQVMVLKNQGIAAWDETGKHMSLIRTRQDIRYAYYDYNYVNDMVESQIQPQSYDKMCELLAYYTECNRNYANLVYTDAAFEGEMEMLPDPIKGAVWVEKAFEYGFQNFDQMLECLGKSVQVYPALADKMREFIQMVGAKKEEELQAQNAESNQARDELSEMAAQVKGQIQVMMQSGMYEQAYQIVQQLRGMLPEDEELLELEKELKRRFS